MASPFEAPFLGYTLELVKGDALSRLFATIFAIMAFAGGLFALNQNRVTELAAALCYAGSAIGVAFAGDLLTVFIFWELMAIASTLVVWSAGPSARGAGMRYAVIHLFGGVLLMAGIVGEFAMTGSIAFDKTGARHPAALADPGRLSAQRRRTSTVGLAARRLSGKLVERHGRSCQPSPPRPPSMCSCADFREPNC